MIIEGHNVEKATEMVDAMESSRVGTAYLALTVAPATEGKHAQIIHGLLNETGPFLVPVPWARSIQPKFQAVRPGKLRTTSKGGPVFSKLFRLDRTDPLSFGPKFPESLVEWIAPRGRDPFLSYN